MKEAVPRSRALGQPARLHVCSHLALPRTLLQSPLPLLDVLRQSAHLQGRKLGPFQDIRAWAREMPFRPDQLRALDNALPTPSSLCLTLCDMFSLCTILLLLWAISQGSSAESPQCVIYSRRLFTLDPGVELFIIIDLTFELYLISQRLSYQGHEFRFPFAQLPVV